MTPSRFSLIVTLGLLFALVAVGARALAGAGPTLPGATGAHLQGVDPSQVDWKAKDLDWWKANLSEPEVKVCRLAGTERPFTGSLLHTKDPGVFLCGSCGQALFDVDHKFDSGTGWPSFTAPVSASAVTLETDISHGMVRTEVRCSRCDAHLGHVFNDGPAPTHKRYCINSVCLLHRADAPESKAAP